MPSLTGKELRDLGYSVQNGVAVRQGAAVVAQNRPVEAQPHSAGPRYRSKLEAAYAAVLDAQKRVGQLIDWRYEEIGLRLADDVYYYPDFLLIERDAAEVYRYTFDEVKGRRQGKGWELGRAKLRIAAQMHPWYTFRLVTKGASGWDWQVVRV